jgi:uncharacterized membrane protein YeaQ/YmgE (transglycosylase-associated protein family)
MQATDLLSAVLIGLFIGVLGRLIIPGRQRIGVFVTLLIGVGSALLGSLVATVLKVNNQHVAHAIGLTWDWVALSIQVGFAVIGTGLAAALTHTVLARNETPRRTPRARKPRTKSARS